MGNASTKPLNSQSVKLSTKQLSSFGEAETHTKFKNKIRDLCDKGKLPPFKVEHLYRFWVWGGKKFSHTSVVIAPIDIEENKNYVYFTIELQVDPEKNIVYPFSQIVTQTECKEKKYIINEKWVVARDDVFVLKKNFFESAAYGEALAINTTVSRLVDYAIELVKNHGKYSSIGNNCRDFVNGYICGMRNPDDNVSVRSGAIFIPKRRLLSDPLRFDATGKVDHFNFGIGHSCRFLNDNTYNKVKFNAQNQN